jgi:hypothetical protein
MRLSRNDTEEYKVWIALAGAVLVLLFHLWHRFVEPLKTRWATASGLGLKGLLAVLCMVGFANYSRLDLQYTYGERVDAYDLTHYYLNAKYFDQLGYYDLYPAVLLADLEAGGPHFDMPAIVQFQNAEKGYYFVQYADFQVDTTDHARIRALFDDPAQWEQFKHDFVYLQRDVTGFTTETWGTMVLDHGFNGAPTWVMVAKPLAKITPVERVKLLCYIDVVWLALAVVVTAWAFGGEAAGFLFLFLMVTYSLRWPTLTWAYGRYDYVSMLIIAVGLLKKLKHDWAGAITALATSFRVFPAVWLFGPAMKGLIQLGQWGADKVRKVAAPRPFPMRLTLLGVAFFCTHLALWGAVATSFQSTKPIDTHFENLFEHTTEDNLSSMRQGFSIATAYTPDEAAQGVRFVFGDGTTPTHNNRMNQRRRDRIKDQKPWRKPLAIGLVLALGFGLRRKKDHEAFAFGFIPFFLMATASYYYYVVRGTLVAMHAGGLKLARNAVGLGGLFLLEALTHHLQSGVPKWRVIHIGTMGWILTAYTVVMIVWVNWESYQEDKLKLLAPEVPPPAS